MMIILHYLLYGEFEVGILFFRGPQSLFELIGKHGVMDDFHPTTTVGGRINYGSSREGSSRDDDGSPYPLLDARAPIGQLGNKNQEQEGQTNDKRSMKKSV
jgi:hypothetical protein